MIPLAFSGLSLLRTNHYVCFRRTCNLLRRHRISCQIPPVRYSEQKFTSESGRGIQTQDQRSQSLSTRIIVSQSVPDHSDWRFAGPPLEHGPLPTVIYLSLTAELSLELDPYNQFVQFLGPSTQSNFRVFSVTLPFHTSDMMENETAFEKWADTYKAGGDLVSGFVRKVNYMLDKFIKCGLISDGRIYVAGLSRGGLLAAHIAAANPNVQACLGFAPVTVLHYLEEFADLDIFSERAQQKIHRASLLDDRVVRGLVSIPLRFYMGNSDTRVGTKNAFEFVHLLAERSVKNGVRSPPHEFIMYCSVGKQGHGTPPDVFRAGAEYMLSQMQQLQQRKL